MIKSETLTDKASRLTVSQIIQQSYYPSLNGLRGLSILMVIGAHLQLSSSFWYPVLFNGTLGVNIFFVLSGFLITVICLKEKHQTGQLSLKNFYLRRALRILPVAYLYLLVLLILDHFFLLHIPYFQLLGAAFFVMDFSYFNSHSFNFMVAHYWSLSVEEQFYLILPFILKRSYKVFFWCIVFLVAALPLLSSAQAFVPFLNTGGMYYLTHFCIKFQSIAVGCLLASLAFNKAFDHYRVLSYKIAGNLIAIALILYLHYDAFFSPGSSIINLLIAILIAYIILSNLVPANDFIYRFLNNKVISWIGIISYSIYIWQQLFTLGDARLPRFLTAFPNNLLFIAIVSCGSYFIFEKYFLKFKKRFSR